MFIIYPLLFGLIGGLLIECTILISSFVISPFVGYAEAPFLKLVLLVSIFAILLTIPIVFFYIKYMVNLDSQYNVKKIIAIQSFIIIPLVIAFWNIFALIFDAIWA